MWELHICGTALERVGEVRSLSQRPVTGPVGMNAVIQHNLQPHGNMVWLWQAIYLQKTSRHKKLKLCT